MIPADLLPRRWRRGLIDSVYGAEDKSGARIYMAVLWGGLAVLALLLTGTTPWAWPAERDGRVESLQPVSCEAIFDADQSASAVDLNRTASRNGSRGSGTAGQRRTQCSQSLDATSRAQLLRLSQVADYLRLGGAPPPALDLPDGSALRDWSDDHICGLNGAAGADRGALAWHVQQGIGECGGWSRSVARLPLAIWWGPVLGVLFTPLILLALLYFLVRHTVRLPSTRRAYRRLYGSEHKAP